MILLIDINFQSGDFYYSSAKLHDYLPIIISAIALFVAFINVRFQMISLIQRQLADKAKDCNDNINSETQQIIDTPQTKSKIVSSIVTANLLINRLTKSNCLFFPFGFGKQSLIDQFYLQLHTSIIEYIIAGNNRNSPDIVEGQIDYHIGLQLNYCNKLFCNSIKKFGNATPREIEIELNKFKESKKKKI